MKKILILSLVSLIGFFGFVETSNAIRLTLKRVVFEGPKRAEVVTIINNSDKEQTYRLDWRNFKMTPDESLEAIPEGEPLPPEIKPVSDFVMFAPRRFTIPPNSSQQVRMMLRAPADLADGEYRSHFWIRPEADVEALRAKTKQSGDKSKNGVSLTMLAGVTMPVIVRKGAMEATVSIASLAAKDNGGALEVSFALQRAGNRSVYGDIDYVCNPGSGSEYFLRATRGIAVYTETDHRNFKMNIAKPEGKPACANLSVSFSETQGFDGDKLQIMAQEIVAVK